MNDQNLDYPPPIFMIYRKSTVALQTVSVQIGYEKLAVAGWELRKGKNPETIPNCLSTAREPDQTAVWHS